MKERGPAALIFSAMAHWYVARTTAPGMALRIAVANRVMAVRIHATVQSPCAKKERVFAAKILNAVAHLFVAETTAPGMATMIAVAHHVSAVQRHAPAHIQYAMVTSCCQV